MSKRRPSSRRLDPDEVLSGRVQPALADLLDLIHRVNPTGLGLGAREAELRYAQKSRLQSLLVRRFAGEIEVAPDPDEPGTVLLRRRGHGTDACHARTSALDEDARAWVQMQVDLGPPSEPRPPPAQPSARRLPPADEPDDDDDPDSLVARAEAAAGAYDYERAQALLTRAVRASGGAAEPAAVLLALLVDTLGADAEALALEASLGKAAMAEPRVRGALATAAARAGDEGRALSLARGIQGPRAAAVFAELAARALLGGELGRAEELLAALRREARTHPAVQALGAEIERARAAERAPAEAALRAVVASGSEEEIVAEADALLARWPTSEAARRAKRAVEAARQRREQERAEAEARAARAEEARLARERVARVVAALGAGASPEALGGYLELDDAQREEVRAHCALEALRWVELSGRGPLRARVEAVLGLARAAAATEPEAALAALAPHAALLERVAEAKQIARRAEARIAEARAAAAMQALSAARAALARGSAREALGLLDEATARALPAAEQAAALALSAEAQRIVDRERRAADVGRLRAAGLLFDARAIAEELGESSAAEERERWEVERRAIQEDIQRAFRVEVDEQRRPFDVASDLSPRNTGMEPLPWITPDGREVVIAQGHGPWVRLHVLDLAGPTLRAALVLRAPEPLGNVSVAVIGRTAWLLGERGGLLALALDTWHVRLFRGRAEVLPAGATSVEAQAFPVGDDQIEPRCLWALALDEREEPVAVRVVHLAQRRVLRELAGAERLYTIPAAPAPRVLCVKPDGPVLCDERGAPVAGRRALPAGYVALGAAPHPEGDGVVLLVARAEEGGAATLGWVEAPSAGPWSAPQLIERGASGAIVCGRDSGLVVIVLRNQDGGSELLALRARRGALEPVYRAALPEHLGVLQDIHGRRLLAAAATPTAVRLVELGDAPPDLPLASSPEVRWTYDLLRVGQCFTPARYLAPLVRDVWRTDVEGKSAAELGIWGRGLQRATVEEGQVVTAVELILLMSRIGAPGAAEGRRLRAWIYQAFGDNFNVRILQADEHARAKRWREAAAVFASPCEPRPDLDEDARIRHAHHLRALAAYHTGDWDGAREALDAAHAYPGPCDLGALDQAFATPGPASAPLTALVAALPAADALLDAGDARRALDLLDRPFFRLGYDVQHFARLAEAHLRLAPEEPWPRFRKIAVLASFLELHGETRPTHRLEVPFPGSASWGRARLDEIAARAARWLEESGPRPRP